MDSTKIGDRMMTVQGMADLSHAERTVLSCIAFHDGPDGAYPSVETLCAEAGGMSRLNFESIREPTCCFSE